MASAKPAKFIMRWTKKSGGRAGGVGSSSKRKRKADPSLLRKHRSSKFSRRSTRGIVKKLDSVDVRTLVTDPDSHVIIRSLGPRVDTFYSQQTVYLESEVDNDLIDGM